MAWVASTVENITSLFLYGTDEVPSDPALRLRRSDAPEVLQGQVDVHAYMTTGAGRFSSIFQTQVVKNFFSGALNFEAFPPDEAGNRSFTLGSLIASGFFGTTAGGLPNTTPYSVSISQYTTGVNDSDYVDRAYVWGSTSFRLSDQTTFQVINGLLSIKGGSMRPYNTNFDLESSSSIATFASDNYFDDKVDPYKIGRTLNLNFSDAGKNAWDSNFVNSIVYASDAPIILADYINGYSIYSTLTQGIYNLILASGLGDRLSTATKYVENGYNIVFGSNAADTLNGDSGKGLDYDPALPNHYVAGEGNDTITLSETKDAEKAHGGAGNDTISFGADLGVAYGGTGDDIFYGSTFGDEMHGDHGLDIFHSGGGEDILDGGGSSDTFHLQGSGAYVTGGLANDKVMYAAGSGDGKGDRLLDADAGDMIFYEGTVLRGGQRVLDAYNGYVTNIVDYPSPFEFINADRYAMYRFEDSIYIPGENDLRLSMIGGQELFIESYNSGDAKVFAEDRRVIDSYDIAIDYPSLRSASHAFRPVGEEIIDLYQGLVRAHVDYIIINAH